MGVRTSLRRCAYLVLAFAAIRVHGMALDPMLSGSNLWQTDKADFAQQTRMLGFHWLSAARDRAETDAKSVTLFSRRVYEVDADFNGDKLGAITVWLYNRGDAGDLEKSAFAELVRTGDNAVTEFTGVQPVAQEPPPTDAVKMWGWVWQTPVSTYKLEYSFTKEVKTWNIPFRAEFVRLKITPPEKPKSFMAEALASATPSAESFDGPSHVKKDPSGDVRIETVPMVDQGQKGYCVVATAERVLRYYGIPVDEHQLAELANSSASQGTSNNAIFDSLKKLSQRLRLRVQPLEKMDVRQFLTLIKDYNRRAHQAHEQEIPDEGTELDVQQIYAAMNPSLFKEIRTHNKAEVDRFQQMAQDHIDQGVPVLWTVMLGILPEDKPPTGIGGHMRLIIGYNPGSQEILYTDSWGPGNELKRMPATDAWAMTLAMDTIEPL